MTTPAASPSLSAVPLRPASINPYERGRAPRGEVPPARSADAAPSISGAADAAPSISGAADAGAENVTPGAAPLAYTHDGRLAAAPRGPLGRLVDVRG